MRTAAVLVLPLGLALACDPTKVTDDAVGKAADKVGEIKEAEAKKNEGIVKEVDAAAKKKEDVFVDCMAACAASESTEPTDRATCRLQCKQKTGDQKPSAPSSTDEAVLRAFDACESKCEAAGSSSNVATCRFNCTQTVAVSATSPRVTAEAKVRGCSSACLEDLVSCDGKCPPGDDGSTCSLHCETDAKRCLARCG